MIFTYFVLSFYKKEKGPKIISLNLRFYFHLRKIIAKINNNFLFPSVNINAVLWPERFAVSHFHLRHSLIEILQRAIQLQSHFREFISACVLIHKSFTSENPWEYYSFGRHLPLSCSLRLASYVIVYDYTHCPLVCQQRDCIYLNTIPW